MTTEHNKATVRRIFEHGINQGELSLFDDVIDPTYVNHTFAAPGSGSESFKQVISLFRDSFPDLYITLHEVLGKGDRVATRGEWQGTHRET